MPLYPHPPDPGALKINSLLKDGLNHLSDIQREIVQSVFGAFGKEKIKPPAVLPRPEDPSF